MNKRQFLQQVGLGIVGVSFASVGLAGSSSKPGKSLGPTKGEKSIFPKALKIGDTLGIIAPSGVLDEEESIQLCRETLEAMGFRVQEGRHIRARYGHLAGTDQERLADIHAMFDDPQIAGIVCIRGGSGAARLLDQLDYSLIKRNPKVFLGYSDITALEMAIYSQTGLVTFHGPVGSSSWPMVMVEKFNDLLMANKIVHFENPVSKGDYLIQRKDRIQTIHPGQAAGRLLGGNLAVLTGICGSPYLPDFQGAILFIEEVGEDLYRVERMFSQLKLAGILGQLSGFIFGKCTSCNPAPGYGSLTLEQILADYIKPLGIPAYAGAIIGHIAEQFIVPVGAEVQMDATKGVFQLTQKALS